MHILIKAEFEKVVPEIMGLSVATATRLKTKTRLEMRFPREILLDREALDADVGLMTLEGEPVSFLQVIVEGTQSLGRLVNRTVKAFGQIGLSIQPLKWEASSGVITIAGNLRGNDLPFLVEIIQQLVLRATKTIKKAERTQYPITLYGLKQIIGLTYDLEQNVEGAAALAAWMAVRELTVLEEIQEAKAVAKAEAKAKDKIKRHRAGAAGTGDPKRKAGGAEKNVPTKSRKGGRKGPPARTMG